MSFLTQKVAEGIIVVLLLVLAGLGIKLGFQSIELAHAQANLANEKVRSQQLSSSLDVQTAAVKAGADEAKAARTRYDQAIAAASKTNIKYVTVLAQAKEAKGVTCIDAMSIVNAALKAGAQP